MRNYSYVKKLVGSISLSGHKFFVFTSLALFILVPITVFAILQSRDIRSLATHQDCFDLNGDFIVTSKDVDLVVAHFGVSGGSPGYIAQYDLNHDGSITSSDVLIEISHTNEICNPTASFSANPGTITKGASSTLSWNVRYANSVRISPSVGNVSLVGSRSVSPTSTTTYNLYAINNWGRVVQKNITVTVRAPNGSIIPGPDPSSGTVVNTLKTIKFKINTPYLVGNLSTPLKVGGKSKTIKISAGSKTYSFGVSKDKLPLNRKLTIEIGGRGVLKKRLGITPKKETVTVHVGTLLIGDMNGNNKIADGDKVIVLEAITNQTAEGDVNIDGVSNSLDWAILMANFGKVGKL